MLQNERKWRLGRLSGGATGPQKPTLKQRIKRGKHGALEVSLTLGTTLAPVCVRFSPNSVPWGLAGKQEQRTCFSKCLLLEDEGGAEVGEE